VIVLQGAGRVQGFASEPLKTTYTTDGAANAGTAQHTSASKSAQDLFFILFPPFGVTFPVILAHGGFGFMV
jgi:hypothetical protein